MDGREPLLTALMYSWASKTQKLRVLKEHLTIDFEGFLSFFIWGNISPPCMQLGTCTNNRNYVGSIHLLCWKKVQFYSVALYKPRLDIIQMTLAPVIFVQLIHILSRHRKTGIFHAYARGKNQSRMGAEMLLQRFTQSCISRRECFCCLQHFFSLQNCQNRKSCFLMCFVWVQFVPCVREVSHLAVRVRCG